MHELTRVGCFGDGKIRECVETYAFIEGGVKIPETYIQMANQLVPTFK